MFEQKYEKYKSVLPENFQFLEVKFSLYLNRRVFVMGKQCRSRSQAHGNDKKVSFLLELDQSKELWKRSLICING